MPSSGFIRRRRSSVARSLWFRRCYQFHRLKNVVFTLLIAVAVFGIWIGPQYFLNFAPRAVGFDPTLLESNSATYWSTILFRFLRLVVIVPLVEEVFWRDFLLRFVIDEHFERVPLGKFNWLSFAVVTLAFIFSHSRPDWRPRLSQARFATLLPIAPKVWLRAFSPMP